MAADMLWYFSCPFWEKAHSNNSQQRHFETNSCHCNISNVLYNLNCVRSVNHSRDATCLGFNGYRGCRADSCLTLTEREACERRPVRRLTERLTRKRASCSTQDLCISSTQTVLLDDPCATTYKQFGKICICHIGYVAICQTRKIDICWSSNIAICQPCNTAICENMKLKITSSI